MFEFINYSADNRRLNILCVDDEKSILKALSRILRKLDVNLHFAKSGANALGILDEHPIDIVISDMKMPGMSGAAFLKESVARQPDTVRMLMTGYSDMDSTISAINDGKIDHFIQKPWNTNDLLKVIHRTIRNIRLDRENKRLKSELEQSHLSLQQCNQELEKKVDLRTRQIRAALKKVKHEQTALEKVLFNLVSINPLCDGRMNKLIAQLCENISRAFKLDNELIQQITLAGLLNDIGVPTIEPDLTKKPFLRLTYDQKKRFYKQVDRIPYILSPLNHLPELEPILCQQFGGITEGHGYPKFRRGKPAHIGARILSFARDYIRYQYGKMSSSSLSPEHALREMRMFRGIRYDQQIFDLINENPSLLTLKETEQGLRTKQLKPGMILLKPIFGQNDIMLLSEGHEFTNSTIDKLLIYEMSQKTELNVIVQVPQPDVSK